METLHIPWMFLIFIMFKWKWKSVGPILLKFLYMVLENLELPLQYNKLHSALSFLSN